MNKIFNLIVTPLLPGYMHLELFSFFQVVSWPKKVLNEFFRNDDFKVGMYKFIGIGIGPRYFGYFYAGIKNDVPKTDKT